MADALLAGHGLCMRFGGVAALSEVDIAVSAGAIHGLIGPNGAGKTTLLNAISRLVTPQSGSLRFDGIDLLQLPAWRVARCGISRTFQNFGLVPELSVLDNVMAGMHARHPATLLDELLRPRRRAAAESTIRRRAQGALERFGLAGLGDRSVTTLPYGLRKAAELARAAAMEPKLLLLDEPTAGLSQPEMATLRQTLLALRASQPVTILVITHHIEFLLGVADEITVLDLGRTIARGDPSLVRTHPDVVRAYVGGAPA